MGVLAPLFLIGLAGLSLPLILHLVRRTPRGRQEFSSLMFLAPTPPRLTRRSRLDQIFLLLLRLTALALLALAFARPFWREASLLSLSDLPRRRVALLIDVSASLRRGDLWTQTLRQAEQELANLAPQDEVALFTFADRVETVVPFPPRDNRAGIPTTALIRQRLAELQPTWAAGDLGSALRRVAEDLAADTDVQQSLAEPQIVVVSDFQKGSRVDSLQGFEWPPKMHATLRPVTPAKLSNASVRLLASDDAEPDALRVRVSNAADSAVDQFFVRWGSAKEASQPLPETAVHVPPGQSRVVKLPRPEKVPTADRILLRGDDHDFDNVFYVVPPQTQQITLLYAGRDAPTDPQGLRYYLQLACTGDPLREVEVQAVKEVTPARLNGQLPPQVVVLTEPVAADTVAALTKYVEQGGTLLVVPRDAESASLVTQFIDDVEPPSVAGPSSPEYLLLGEIDFKHPLFAPLDNPRYNDFTRIHFWKHRPLRLKTDATTHAVVRFDNGDPWLLERTAGRGRLLALTSGWQPDDSQLAVSSKFVPLVGNLLDLACGSAQPLAGVAVNEPVPLPADRTAALTLRLPDATQATIPARDLQFTQTRQPGIYEATGTGDVRFAVNLADSESDTAPLAPQTLAQLGVPLGTLLTRAQELARMRQERDTELESRQNLWRWLLVGCVAVLIFETWWSGRGVRPRPPDAEAVT